MIVRSSRALLLFFAAALLGLALMLGALFYQLSRGPISLSFLTPLVERALNSALDGTRITLHDTVLAWEGPTRQLDIRATGVTMLDADGEIRATVPEMTVAFSARALSRGLVAPTKLELFGPRLKIVRMPDGVINVGFGGQETPTPADADTATTASGTGAGAARGLLDELLRAPDPDLESGYLTGIGVRSAYIEFDDRMTGRMLVASRANVTLTRTEEDVRADASIVIGEGDDVVRLDLTGTHRIETGTTDLGLVFGDLAPAALANIEPAFAPAARLDSRLEGTITLALDRAFRVRLASADLRAGAGTVDAAPYLAEPVPFQSAILRANAGEGLDRVSVETFELLLPDARLALSGEGVRAEERWRIALQSRIEGLPVNAIGNYWPADLEPNAREWITGNIRDGEVEVLTLSANASVPETDPGSLTVNAFEGEVRFQGATVHYLRPMEPITDGVAVARFNLEEVVIDVLQGRLRDIVAESGTVTIDGLDGPSRGETIKIEATVAGPVRDALQVLDSEPLGFISDFGIDPDRTTGSQRTNAVFAFPLLNEIKVDDIAVATSSRLTGFSAAEAAFGLPVSNGELVLKVDRNGLEATGTAKLGVIPVELTWSERFERDGEIRTKYRVRTTLDEAARQDFGLDAAPYLSGPVSLGLTYSVGWNGASAGAADIDLGAAGLSLEPFDYRKRPGEGGKAFVRFHSRDGGPLSVPEIRVTAPDLDVVGRATFAPAAEGFDVQTVEFSRLVFGETDARVTVSMLEGGIADILVTGEAVDLRPIVEDMLSDDAEGEDDEQTPLSIRISEAAPLGSVRLGEETHLLDVRGALTRGTESWSEVNLRGRLSNAGDVLVQVVPDGDSRLLLVETGDAGGLLRALDLVDTIRSGDLRVRGTFRGTGAEEVLQGQVDMEEFVLTEEPFAAKLLALASFSGIADVLGGDGITFRRAEIPFRLTDDEITIEDAKARGAEIGIIASGRIDRQTDTIALSGEVAPAYTLNSLLANIPLIGQVLSGGSEGIFAATFRVDGSLDSPDISVNPLAVLTPGIIRRILEGFGEGEPAPPRTPQPGETLQPEID